MDEEVVAQLRAFGAPDSVIEAATRPRQIPQPDFFVWEENWPAVVLFASLGTQWRLHLGMAGVYYQGLDYGAVEVALRLERIPRRDWPALFADLRVMERAALPLMNEKL